MNNKVPKREKVFYTVGLTGQNIIWGFMGLYIMFFFTDLLKISPATTTAILVAASLWDASNDVLSGMIIDRTRSRWGKFRPYLIFASGLIAIMTILCFADFKMTPTLTAVFAGIIYILWGTVFDFVDVPLWALSSVISKDPKEKTSVVTLGKIGSIVGTALVTVFSITLIEAFGGEREASAYFVTAIVISVFGALTIFLTGVFCKERVEAKKEEKIPFRENFKTIYKNTPLIVLMVTLLLFGMVNHIRQNLTMYYVVYVLGDAGYTMHVGISLVVGMLLGMGISPMLLRKFQKRSIFFLICIIGTVFCALPFFIGSVSALVVLILLGVSFFFTGIGMITTTSMLMDGIDYSEWKLGFRGEGIVFSTQTLLGKLSATFAKLLIGAGLVILNYFEGMVPTAELQRGLNFLMFLLPAVFFLIAIIPMLFYRVSSKKQSEILEELEQRRGT